MVVDIRRIEPSGFYNSINKPQKSTNRRHVANRPEFLRRPENEWPISQEFTVESNSLPDVIGLIHHAKQEFPVRKNRKLDDINPSQYNELNKLIRVTAIILGIAKNRSFRFNVDKLSQRDMEDAERE